MASKLQLWGWWGTSYSKAQKHLFWKGKIHPSEVPALLTTETMQNHKVLKAVPSTAQSKDSTHSVPAALLCSKVEFAQFRAQGSPHLCLFAECHHLTTQTDFVGTPRLKNQLKSTPNLASWNTLSVIHASFYRLSHPPTAFLLACTPKPLEFRRGHTTEVKQGCHCLMYTEALQVFHNIFLTTNFKMWHPPFFCDSPQQATISQEWLICWYKYRPAWEQHCWTDVLCLH